MKLLVSCLGAIALACAGCAAPNTEPPPWQAAGGGEPEPEDELDTGVDPLVADLGALDAPFVPEGEPIQGDDDDDDIEDDDPVDDDPVEGDDDDGPVDGDDDDDPVEGDDDDDPIEGDDDDEVDGIPEEEDEEEELADPLPGCEDDNFETNDDFTEAAAVLEGAYNAMVACSGDLDWYTMPLLTGDTLNVDLEFDSAAGDLTLEVYDPEGNLVASADTEGDAESLSVDVTTNGDWLVLAFLDEGSNGSPSNDYSIVFEVIEVECPTDPYEPNDSDLAPWPLGSGSWSGLQVCPYGDDFFAVWLEPGEEMTAEVAFEPDDGDLDLTLLDPTGLVLSWASTDEETELASAVAASSGWHVVWVELTEDADMPEAAGATYDLTLVAP